MAKHINLLQHGDKQEVYEALQKHFQRDMVIIGVLDAVWIGCGFMSLNDGKTLIYGWVLAAAVAIVWRMTYYIDNSHRNWTMHLIDWIESGGWNKKE